VTDNHIVIQACFRSELGGKDPALPANAHTRLKLAALVEVAGFADVGLRVPQAIGGGSKPRFEGLAK
jgi:ABC-type thiamine transport system ATPase subunit